MTMTISEMEKRIEELTTKYDASVKNFETYKAEAEAKMKKAEAEDNDDKKIDKAEGKSHKGEAEARKARFHKAMKSAAEEKDEKKREEHMKEAMTHYKAEDHDDDNKKIDEKEASVDAELIMLRAEVAKPKLQYLNTAYKGRVDEKVLKEYQASWEKMDIKQLDSEISKVQPFLASITTKKNTEQPLGFSTIQMPQAYKASTDDEFSASLEKKSVEELFGVGN